MFLPLKKSINFKKKNQMKQPIEEQTNKNSKKFFTDKEFDKISTDPYMRTGIGKTDFEESIPNYKNKTASPAQTERILDMQLQTSQTINILKHLNVKNIVEKISDKRLEEQQDKMIKKQKGISSKKGLSRGHKTERVARNIKDAAKGMDIN